MRSSFDVGAAAPETARDFARAIDRRVALRIRQRRLRMGMTQQQLARRIGVAFQQAHKYERGLSRISAGRLFHIAAALDAPISYFFEPDPELGEAAAVPRHRKVADEAR